MATEKDIDDAVDAERNRCVELMDLHRKEFDGSPLSQVWTRVRNLIAIGTDPAKSDFASQFFDDDDFDE